MTKRDKIIYWIATIWLALGMLSTGTVQLLKLAVFSYIASGDSLNEIFPSLLLLLLTVVSWYFRPVDRKSFQLVNNK